MEHPVEFENRGQRLAGILHMPQTKNPPIVIISHGLTGNKDKPLLVACAKALEENGFAVLRFDYRGNGQSSGQFEKMTIGSLIEDLTAAIDAVQKIENVNTNKIGVLSHSFGCLVTVLNNDPRIKSAVLITPIVKTGQSLANYFTHFNGNEWEQDFLRDKFIFLQKKKGYKVSWDFWDGVRMMDMSRDIQDFDKPTLFIGSTEDRNVPLKEFRDIFYAANEPKEKVEIMGDHSFREKEDTVCPHIIKWFNKWLNI